MRLAPCYGSVCLSLLSVCPLAYAEAASVDRTVSRQSSSKSKTYTVSGRIKDSAGRPLPNVSFSYKEDMSVQGDRWSFSFLIYPFGKRGKADSRGEFTIEDLPSGKYVLNLSSHAGSPWYIENAGFEVANGDIEGLEMTAKPAGSVSGVAVLEGTKDPAVIDKFSQLKICQGDGFGIATCSERMGKDGTFKMTGVGPSWTLRPAFRPERNDVFLRIDSDSLAAGFEILRVEKDGVEPQYNSIEVEPGENVSGVKVFVACYKGSVRGQIAIRGGYLPADGCLEVSATPVEKPAQDTSLRNKSLSPWSSRPRLGEIDALGRFTIERLPPGEYEIDLTAHLGLTRFKEFGTFKRRVTRLVTVTGDDPVETSLVLDLSRKY